MSKYRNGLTEEHKKKVSISKQGKKNPRARKVINTSTGVVYETATAAAKSIDMLPITLINKLLGHRRNNTDFKYLNDDKRPGRKKAIDITDSV